MFFEIMETNWEWDAEMYGEVYDYNRRIVEASSVKLVKQLVNSAIEKCREGGFGSWERDDDGRLVRQRPLGQFPRVVKYSIKEVHWRQTEIPGLKELTSR